MTIGFMAFAVGAILVLTAILGGGFELREVKVPRVGVVSRGVAAVTGAAFILFGVGTEAGSGPAGDGEPQFVSVVPSALSSSAFLPVPAQQLAPASPDWLEQVNGRLAEIEEWALQQGLALDGELRSGEASEGEATTVELTLEEGGEYGIMAVCDDDCSDLDLKLLDGAGNVLMEDVEPDAYPRLLLAPEGSGTYYASVHMASCAAETCLFGIGVYRR